MRQILAGLLILIASTLSGAAQTISVRGGEHQGFTRLVFDLPRALNWELETGDGTATLGFGGGSFRFDFKSAFNV